ncbi:MAG: hypothetical protein ABIW82_04660 [Dokdonella sp.]
MRKASCTPVTIGLGLLKDDATLLARRAYQSLMDGPRLIWADDAGRVYSTDCEDPGTNIPACWIAGTFAFGQPIEAIEDDLLALRSERSRDWIID